VVLGKTDRASITEEYDMEHHARHGMQKSYRAFSIEMAIDFLIMYFVMYTMIATVDHLYLNINNVYMTLMMVAPMSVVMLLGMRQMFPSRRLNLVIGAAAVIVFVASFIAMRTQGAVGDEQFLRSMIPHHSGAILMCEQSAITDPEIRSLCERIVKSQQQEIAQMQSLLAKYSK
jgi:uncharacterized protein (DUF305 family)